MSLTSGYDQLENLLRSGRYRVMLLSHPNDREEGFIDIAIFDEGTGKPVPISQQRDHYSAEEALHDSIAGLGRKPKPRTK